MLTENLCLLDLVQTLSFGVQMIIVHKRFWIIHRFNKNKREKHKVVFALELSIF